MQYLGNFDNDGDVFGNFEVSKNDQRGVFILLAFYGCADYEGNAFVLFIKDGQLYEVHGSHCSCNGLEGQWQPEETSWEALKVMYLESDNSFYGDDGSALKIMKDLILDVEIDKILLN